MRVAATQTEGNDEMTDCSCTNFPASLGNVTVGANLGVGTVAPAAKLVVAGLGSSQVESGSATTTGDFFGATTDRARLTIGNTNSGTVPGGTSRSAELLFYAYNPAGTALQVTFEVATDAEQNGTQSFFVYDTVARAFRLYLGPTGNVGIGTTTPTTERLVVAGGGMDLTAPATNPTADAGLGLSFESYGGRIQSFLSRPLILNPLGNNVGIGTTSPQQALDVNGTVRATGILLGGNMLLSGAITDSTGQDVRVDAGGCYYAN